MRRRFLASGMFALIAFASATRLCLAEPMDWATAKQKDLASQLASAYAGTEICDYDIDPDRVEVVLRENFGDKLSAKMTSDLMYMVVVLRAVQGVQIRGQKRKAIEDRCVALKGLFGATGSQIKGVVR